MSEQAVDRFCATVLDAVVAARAAGVQEFELALHLLVQGFVSCDTAGLTRDKIGKLAAEALAIAERRVFLEQQAPSVEEGSGGGGGV